jgi:putative flippase GtrA
VPESPSAGHNYKRFGKFGLVGIFNTGLDFLLYNLLSSFLGFGLVTANIISTTVAMTISFLANKRLVFAKRDGSAVRQAALFFGVTAFGMYVLQSGTIHLLTEYWLAPLEFVVSIAHAFGIVNHDEFIIKNGAKAAATIVSMSWNYIMYKKVVFS